jgi:hypothetical protein
MTNKVFDGVVLVDDLLEPAGLLLSRSCCNGWLINYKKGQPCIYEVNTFSLSNMETNPWESKEKQTEAIARVAHSWREDGRKGVRGSAKIFINILNNKLGLVFLCESQKLRFLTPQAHKLTYKGHV